ncbi:hypothetical protein CAPTEDRAFT_19163 [Capitella teleta]|uniref:BTB domain-containing protein n=1 Tax=Capitella teleta TaxID=283909 RepID=R7U256_CAPTE|nr:hypothetical protein CAPTEDRAFT_19163 [Capitella teleta]|eukprot:ELT99957.1 hypothetical protein CAPTEDRAFT_19163 [Capitella teleta]
MPSPTPANQYPKYSGVPCPATPTRYTAPVHIDVGGSIYTSSLETLTKYPESRLAKMFNGNIPIILDSLKQHYFIDRDGKMFRHVLNYMRTGRLSLPDNFTEIESLMEEAHFYEIAPMIRGLEERSLKSERRTVTDCVVLNVCPDLGERISLSADKALLEELFPELSSALMDSRNTGWNVDTSFVMRFPLNGYCKLNSLQVMQRVLSDGFSIAASNGGGVEGQQFSEYVFCRTREAPLRPSNP